MLGRFLDGQDAAFEALVTRHGPMVLRLCRGVLDDPHDAQDAFQATFLVLVRRAGSIQKRESVSSWFDLMGCGYEEAARVLDCPLGTLKARLSRARARLRERLTLRGLADAFPVKGPPQRSRAHPKGTVPAALARVTARAAAKYGTSRAAALAAGTVSARVVFLTERIVSSMFLARLKLIAALTLVLGVSATGIALFRMAAPGPAATKSAPPTARPVPTKRAPPTARPKATKPAPPTARPEAPVDAGRLVLTPGDADQLALAIVCRSFPDPAERAQQLVNLGEAEARRGDAAAAKTTLRLAVEAAVAIRPSGPYIFSRLFPHPIYRIAAAQAELGDAEAAGRTLRAAAERIAAEEDGAQLQHWNQQLDYEFRVCGRVSPETVAGYRRCLERRPEYPLHYVLPILLKLQAASGDPKGALREVREGAEFSGPALTEQLRQYGYQGARLRSAALLGILSVVKRGDPVAEEVLEEVKKAVVDQPAPAGGRDSRSQDLLALAKEEVRLGRFADAVASAGSMKMTDILDKSNQAQTFAEIAMAQARAGDRAGALATAREAIALCDTIPDERPYNTLPLGQAVDALIEAGALAEVRKLAETMNPSDRPWLQSQIAEASRAAGDDATALEYLKQGIRAYEEERASAAKRPLPVKGAPDRRNRAITFASRQIAILQAQLGDLPAALSTVATITDARHRDATLRALAIVRASEGDLASARDLVARIGSPEGRGWAWIRIACSLPGPKASKRDPSTPPGPPR